MWSAQTGRQSRICAHEEGADTPIPLSMRTDDRISGSPRSLSSLHSKNFQALKKNRKRNERVNFPRAGAGARRRAPRPSRSLATSCDPMRPAPAISRPAPPRDPRVVRCRRRRRAPPMEHYHTLELPTPYMLLLLLYFGLPLPQQLQQNDF